MSPTVKPSGNGSSGSTTYWAKPVIHAVPVIAVTSAAANVCTIASGPIVFGEPLPDDPAALALRIAAFALVIVAAALTPAPVRLAEPEVEPV